MAAIGDLRARIFGDVIEPDDERYDEARKVWNGMVDKRPAAIVRPAGAADVITVVRLARETGIELAIRCGGHSMSGMSTSEGGIVLDLQRMRGVEVDPVAKTARVAGGTLLAQLDHETTAFGLVTPSGSVGHTGVAGLTLGGGFGRLTRMFGLTVDNMLSAEVVTADGTLVRASEDENDDLFWALRGAGANFGVVTSFTFRLHAFEPMTYNRLAVFDIEAARDVLRAYPGIVADAPDEMGAIAALGVAEANGPFPPELHGRQIVRIGASVNGGTQEDGERLTEVILGIGEPLFQFFLPAPFTVMQTISDLFWAHGRRYYVKGGLLEEITDGAIDAMIGAYERAPLPTDDVTFLSVGGAMGRVPEDAMAYSGRAANFFFDATAISEDPSTDAIQREWARATHEAMGPHYMSANYINAVEDAGDDAARAAYGDEKYKRLVELKTKWDPDNVFRLNQNIKPAR